MLSIRTILHPTDFSTNSSYALGLAGSLARDYGARLIILHIATPPAAVYAEGIVLPEPEGYEEELRSQLQRLQPEGLESRTEHCLVRGGAAAEILRVAEEKNCDLIVMGTHGRSGVGRLLLGSVAEQVIRRAPCPVVTVKTPVKE
jgi:nucleotide-binding universal stress UspA family protein